jgi:TolB-like protein/Flp pilus assembly protein TadD
MIGRTLGRYTVLARLGAGGMGVVYRARDQKLGREVALKVLPASETADPGSRARLMREARLASSLNHPHICVVHEVDEQDGEMFIAMELIGGQSLRGRIGSVGLPVPEVLRLGSEIADALAHAHARGVIHRDLKSLNVMVTPEGSAKVLDFGLARPMTSDSSSTMGLSSRLTETGAVVGTLHSMSPEVLRGEQADVRSDVWALGVLLYEMASGATPFRGETPYEMAASILHGNPAPLPAGVPAGLQAVIMKCLQRDPSQRYQEASEARSNLKALSAGQEPVIAVLPGAKRRWSRSKIGAGASMAVGLVTLVLLLGRYRGCPGAAAIRSLAVLPLANLSGDPSQEYFADGMTDELINTLAQLGVLRVISRTSVMGYKDRHVPVREIARELNVQAVLEGSVRRFQDRVKVTVELIQAAGERVLWGESYERGLTDVLSLQGEVARAIAGQIRLELTPAERANLVREHPIDPDAHEHYLLGRQDLYSEEFSLARIQSALAHFRKAIEIDPKWAMAYSGLGEGYYALSNYYVAPDSAMPEVKKATERALLLDLGLAEAHTMKAVVAGLYEWNWSQADAEFRRAIELNPGSESAHFLYGYCLTVAGKYSAADEQLGIARELDPLSGWTRWISAWPAFYRKDYDGAIQELSKQATIDSTLWMPHSLLGEAYEMKGLLSEAESSLRKAKAMGGNPWVVAALARVYAKEGKRDSTARLLDELARLSKQQYVTPYALATVHMALGDRDRAFALLEQAYRDRSEDLVLLHQDPRFDPLRADPRFDALIKRMKYPA